MKNYELNLFYTSDVHGSLIPDNFGTFQKDLKGLSRLKTFLDRQTSDYLLFDNGDILQGSPLMNYWLLAERSKVSPANLVMNHLGYDYATLGNHDFNYGEDILASYVNHSNAKILCANVNRKDGRHAFTPYDIKILANGIKIGIIGAITQAVPNWEKPENIKDLVFKDAFESVKKYVELLRPVVDCLIVLYHGGIERDMKTGVPLGRKSSENKGYQMAMELPIDILLTGHQHAPKCGMVNHCLVLQTSHSAFDFGSVHLEFTESDGGWNLYSKTGEIVPMAFESDIETEKLIEKLITKTNIYLDQVLVTTDGESLLIGDAFEARKNNHPLFKIVNDAQLWISKAMISGASLPNQITGLNHQISMRDLESTFIYPNTLFVIEVTGKSLKAALEKGAEYFEKVDGRITLSPQYAHPKLEHYNYDIYAGIDYSINVSKPKGERIFDLKYQDKLISDQDVFTLALNNYRAIGGGDYGMYRNQKILKEINMTTAEIVIEYFKEHPHLSVEKLHNPSITL